MPIISYTATPVEDRVFTPLPEGEYTAEIVSCGSKTSQAGNQMLALDLKIVDNEGITRKIKDNVLIGHEKMQWRLKHFMEAVGQSYESGQVDTDRLPLASVLVFVKHEEYEKDGQKRISAKIGDYIPQSVVETSNAMTAARDTALPF